VIDQMVSGVNMSAQTNIAESLAWRAADYACRHTASVLNDVTRSDSRDVLANETVFEARMVVCESLFRGLVNVDEQRGPEAAALLEARRDARDTGEEVDNVTAVCQLSSSP